MQYSEDSRFECISETKRQWFGPFFPSVNNTSTSSGTDMRATIFEVIKIELLDESNSSIMAPNHPNSQRGLIIRVANILQNVEKSSEFQR